MEIASQKSSLVANLNERNATITLCFEIAPTREWASAHLGFISLNCRVRPPDSLLSLKLRSLFGNQDDIEFKPKAVSSSLRRASPFPRASRDIARSMRFCGFPIGLNRRQ
jgi:hypothetical protein